MLPRCGIPCKLTVVQTTQLILHETLLVELVPKLLGGVLALSTAREKESTYFSRQVFELSHYNDRNDSYRSRKIEENVLNVCNCQQMTLKGKLLAEEMVA
jgi:hypothetical protein